MRLVPAISRMVVLALLTVLVVAAQPGQASACSCAEVDTTDMFEQADIAFVGREVSRVATGEQWPSVAVTYEVVAAYKGTVDAQMTMWTGAGDADCGVSPSPGLVGITSAADGGRFTIDICGSVHAPDSIAAITDPIELSGQVAAPPTQPTGAPIWPWVGASGVLAVAGAIWLAQRRRRDDYQDGWNSAGSQ